MRIVSPSPHTTRALAAVFVKELTVPRRGRRGATIIALVGPLGAGKTVFAQGFARALGVKKNLPSPTFTLVRHYRLRGKRYRHLFHVDAYRLTNGTARTLEPLGLVQEFKDPSNCILIEWADRIRSVLPHRTVWITFRHPPRRGTSRILTFHSR
ncbi:MAG: tRNA (adenosine(37)-N6)-threonylcarbamoyltransferase complex ATPase subunit type 1 TsaE [Candidatus Jorgensenbacteria bacterium]|nr:tRNA (adenosine(37)-N6)-threonylcarbamoyltransferase complex ATPase subunit type 1 TsaE [Candidatus Jorgensenbacteria bacterium]